MASGDKDLIQSINERLDARTLIDAIGYRTDKLVLLGGTIKTPCMIHGDERFATLLVHPKKNTCKCLMSNCPANREITLVELVGLHAGKQGVDAAFEAARLSGLSVDESMASEMTESHVEAARKALEEGKLEHAWEMTQKARALDPGFLPAILLSAKVSEKQGYEEQAKDIYLAAARQTRERGDHTEALRIVLEEALRLRESDTEALVELALGYLASDKPGDAANAVLRVCARHEEDGQFAPLVKLLGGLPSELTGDARVRLHQARALEETNELTKAVHAYREALADLTDESDPEGVQAALESLVALDKDDVSARERLSHLHEQAGRTGEAIALVTELGQRALALSEADEAEGYFRRILEKDPGSILAREGMAGVYQCRGLAEEEARERLEIAKLYSGADLTAEAAEQAGKARDLIPENAEAREALAEYYHADGNHEGAAREFRSAAVAWIQAGDDEKAGEAADRAIAIDPDNLEEWKSAAAVFLENDRTEQGLALLERGARERLDSGQVDETIELANAGLEKHETHRGLRGLRVRALLAKGETEEALKDLQHVDVSDLGEEGLGLSEEDLRRVVSDRPEDHSAMYLLADFLARRGEVEEPVALLEDILSTSTAEEGFVQRQAAERLLEINPEHEDALTILAAVCEAQSDGPAAASALVKLSGILDANGKTIEAEERLQKAAELDPECEEALVELVALRRERNDRPLWKEAVFAVTDWLEAHDRPGDGRKWLEELHEALPADVETAERLSELLSATGDAEAGSRVLFEVACQREQVSADQAEGFLRRCSEMAPEFLEARSKRVDLLLQLERSEEAVEQALQLGEKYLEAGTAEKAEAVLVKARKAAPQDERVLLLLADACEKSGKALERACAIWLEVAGKRLREEESEKALEHLERAATLCPGNGEVVLAYAECLNAMGRREEAASAYVQAADLLAAGPDPLDAKPLYDKAHALLPRSVDVGAKHLGFLESIGAIESACNRALDLARLSFEVDDAERALEFVGRAVGLQPQSAEHRRKVAALLYENGQTERAISDVMAAASAQLERATPEGALMLLRWGLEKRPEDPELLKLMVRTQVASGEAIDATRTLGQLARTYEAQDRHEDAGEVWREVLDMDPDSIEARLSLASLSRQQPDRVEEALDWMLEAAELLEHKEDQAGLRQVYEEILGLDTERDDVRAKLARLLLSMEKTSEARDEFVRLAKTYRQQGEPRTAIEYNEKALELDPENPRILRAQMELARDDGDQALFESCALRLAAVFEKAGAFADAVRTCEEILKDDAGNTDARLLMASYLVRDGEPERALKHYLKLASEFSASQDIGRTRDVLARVERLQPLDAEAHEILGRAYLEIESETEGLAHLSEAARSFRAEEKADRSLAVTDLMVQQGAVDGELRRLRAELLEGMNRSEDAAVEVETLAGLQESDPESRRESLEWLLRLDPKRAAAGVELAEGYLAAGDGATAAERFLTVAKGIREDDLDQSVAFAQRAADADPECLEAHEYLLELFREEQRWDEAVEEAVWLAGFHSKAGESDRAAEGLSAISASEPNHPGIREKLGEGYELIDRSLEAAAQYAVSATLHRAEDRFEEAVRLLKRAAELRPGDHALRIQLSDELMAAGKTGEAIEERLAVVQAQVGEGLIDEARTAVDELQKKVPSNKTLRERAAQIFMDNGIPELAAQELASLARVFLGEEEFDEALRLSERVVELNPRDFGMRELQGDVFARKGETGKAIAVLTDLGETIHEHNQYDEAIRVYGKVLELDPERPEVYERLAALYDKLGQKEKLGDTLSRLVDLYRSQEDLHRAATALEKLMALRPDDTNLRISFIEIRDKLGPDETLVPKLIDLAQLYARQGAIEQAARQYTRAIELDDSNPLLRTEFAEALLAAGKNDEALEQVQRAVEQFVEVEDFARAREAMESVRSFGEGKADFHLAQAQVHAGQKARGMALMELEKALKLYREQKNANRQIEVFQQSLALDPQNLEYRRSLIDLLRDRGRIEEAMEQEAQLAKTYMARGLADLAEAEYRKIVESDPSREEVWKALFKAHLTYGAEKDLLEDYLRFADALLEKEEVNEALHHISKVIRLDPHNIAAREKYVDAYLRIGPEVDLCEDYLVLADLLIADNRIDEGVELFNKVMSLDPENKAARDRLSETQARMKGQSVPTRDLSDLPTNRPHETRFPRPKEGEKPDSDSFWDIDLPSPEEAGEESAADPASLLAEELKESDEEDERAALEQVISNYQDILAVNPQNANVRLKLADLYEQLNRQDDSLEELAQASESLFQKGELALCINVCERILKVRPTDQKIRLRLKQAFNKRDAMKALESAIWFVGDEVDETETGQSHPRGQ